MTIHIDQERMVLHGEEARKKLAQENDTKFIKGSEGVLEVDRERWLKAQAFEQKTWMVDGRWTREDNNRFHTQSFGDYKTLRGMSFKNGIELGSGPFTNMRHVASVGKVENIYLLDPLMKKYLKHPFCRYKTGRMWVKENIMKSKIQWPKFKKVHLVDSAIEDYKPKVKFDLMLLINVLEHCQSVVKVWQKILDMAGEGAILVLADKFYDGAELSGVLKDRYDAGHPLKVDQSIIDNYLTKHWDTLYRQVKIRKGRKGRSSWDDHQMVYYIGRKKSDHSASEA